MWLPHIALNVRLSDLPTSMPKYMNFLHLQSNCGSLALTALAHATFVLHMATNIYRKIRPPLRCRARAHTCAHLSRHILLTEHDRMMLYMPHVLYSLQIPNDVFILKGCQLLYVLVQHVPPCTWTREHFDIAGYMWIPVCAYVYTTCASIRNHSLPSAMPYSWHVT
jgi:hypothetical protein